MTGILIQQMKLDFDHSNEQFIQSICKTLGIDKKAIIEYKIVKKSIDARDKNAIKTVYSVLVDIEGKLHPKKIDNKNIMLTTPRKYEFPSTKKELSEPPIIIGSGPAGLFCALILAENGYKPIVLERGMDVDTRMKDVSLFWETGVLKENSNIQFGEGGAGTFSDGKLNTGVKDAFLRKEKILEEFVEAGAPREILYLSKPHIGTDYLVKVVKQIRAKIESLGGEIRFNHLVTDLVIENNQIQGVKIQGGKVISSKHVVLAIGHSARDTFAMLKKLNVPMIQKAFAIGLRIEHPQELIQKSQFGPSYKNSALPVADYKLTYQTTKGRAVYSFCMCPGGFVVNASSEINQIVCNGMSNFKRDARNANSALLVNVLPEDFNSTDVLAGVEFQRQWERAAFEIAGANYNMPVQKYEDFLFNRQSKSLGDIEPCLKGKYQFANLNECLPNFVAESIKEGIMDFDKKIKGFGRPDALLTGVETRSSSPVRILRNERFESDIKGLYPCGEGAGYAGGIMSAAMDGIKVAESICSCTGIK